MTDDEARQAALAAADRLFYERGIRAVRMEEVRDASGVSLKRLYALFPTKDDLAAQVLHRREAEFLTALRRHVERRRTPGDRVLALFDYLAAWFGEDGFRGCAFINAFGELGATSDSVRHAAESQKHALRRLIGELVAAAGGTAKQADQVTMLFNGATVSAAMLGDPRAARPAKDAVRTLLGLDRSATRAAS
jgi:AcrR family transcriptional regulator